MANPEGMKPRIYAEYRGMQRSLREISEMIGIKYDTVYHRWLRNAPLDSPLWHWPGRYGPRGGARKRRDRG